MTTWADLLEYDDEDAREWLARRLTLCRKGSDPDTDRDPVVISWGEVNGTRKAELKELPRHHLRPGRTVGP